MARNLDLTINTRALADLAAELQVTHGTVQAGLVSAVNKTGKLASTQAKRALAKQTGIGYQQLGRSRGLQDVPATPTRVEYTLTASSGWTPLSYFNPAQQKRGVRARPWGKSRLFRGTFMASVGVGHLGVWRRTGSERKRRRSPTTGRMYWSQGKLEELWGPNLAAELTKGEPPTVWEKTIDARFDDQLTHEVARVMAGIGKRRR